eukprot:TRINITY_DN11425_c0_g1_i1.p1 TRINITY_DN11425_c0_g1~~TRINITY_DN11425_c0_g1_i1.p1  ORF type:complete len:2043 (-),score=303.09 TRINITY_DN11425_c0_g1_i1:8-6136(-)
MLSNSPLSLLEGKDHWWCSHPELAASLLLEIPELSHTSLRSTVAQQLTNCTKCIASYHACVQEKLHEWSKEFTPDVVTRLKEGLQNFDVERVLASFKIVDDDARRLLRTMHNVLSFPDLLDNIEVHEGLSAVLCKLQQDFDVTVPTALPGVFHLVFHPNSAIRSWARTELRKQPNIETQPQYVRLVWPIVQRVLCLLEILGNPELPSTTLGFPVQRYVQSFCELAQGLSFLWQRVSKPVLLEAIAKQCAYAIEMSANFFLAANSSTFLPAAHLFWVILRALGQRTWTESVVDAKLVLDVSFEHAKTISSSSGQQKKRRVSLNALTEQDLSDCSRGESNLSVMLCINLIDVILTSLPAMNVEYYIRAVQLLLHEIPAHTSAEDDLQRRALGLGFQIVSKCYKKKQVDVLNLSITYWAPALKNALSCPLHSAAREAVLHVIRHDAQAIQFAWEALVDLICCPSDATAPFVSMNTDIWVAVCEGPAVSERIVVQTLLGTCTMVADTAPATLRILMGRPNQDSYPKDSVLSSVDLLEETIQNYNSQITLLLERLMQPGAWLPGLGIATWASEGLLMPLLLLFLAPSLEVRRATNKFMCNALGRAVGTPTRQETILTLKAAAPDSFGQAVRGCAAQLRNLSGVRLLSKYQFISELFWAIRVASHHEDPAQASIAAWGLLKESAVELWTACVSVLQAVSEVVWFSNELRDYHSLLRAVLEFVTLLASARPFPTAQGLDMAGVIEIFLTKHAVVESQLSVVPAWLVAFATCLETGLPHLPKSLLQRCQTVLDSQAFQLLGEPQRRRLAMVFHGTGRSSSFSLHSPSQRRASAEHRGSPPPPLERQGTFILSDESDSEVPETGGSKFIWECKQGEEWLPLTIPACAKIEVALRRNPKAIVHIPFGGEIARVDLLLFELRTRAKPQPLTVRRRVRPQPKSNAPKLAAVQRLTWRPGKAAPSKPAVSSSRRDPEQQELTDFLAEISAYGAKKKIAEQTAAERRAPVVLSSDSSSSSSSSDSSDSESANKQAEVAKAAKPKPTVRFDVAATEGKPKRLFLEPERPLRKRIIATPVTDASNRAAPRQPSAAELLQQKRELEEQRVKRGDDACERLTHFLISLRPAPKNGNRPTLDLADTVQTQLSLRQVPKDFESENAYVGTFGPLITLEAVASVDKAAKEREYPDETCKLITNCIVNTANTRFYDIELALPKQRGQMKTADGTTKKGLIYYAETDLVLVQLPVERGFVEVFGKVMQYRLSHPVVPCGGCLRVRLLATPELRHLINLMDASFMARSEWRVAKLLSLSPTYQMQMAIHVLPSIDIYQQINGPAQAQPPPKSVPELRTHLHTIFPEPFAKTVSARYNVSQLEAICDSAQPQKTAGFTLVKGPPGTGKTRTVLGVLSALLLPDPVAQNGTLQRIKRVLVCAPSNTAIDEIALRIVHSGLTGPDGKPFKPRVVRIGVREKISPEIVETIYIDTLVDRACRSGEAVPDQLKSEQRVAQLQQEVRQAQEELATIEKTLKAMAINTNLNLKARVAELEKTRTTTAQKLHDAQLALGSERASAGRSKHLNEARRRQVRQQLLAEASVVCSTLGACKDLADIFPVVVIDEAAQAVEPQTIVPMMYGCRRCILVGDPQQLTATVLARGAARMQYDQSLMARLLARGHPSLLLNTQYRMDPAISLFPNKTFYGGLLRDGENVLTRLSSNHSLVQVAPYRFFDVRGVEARGGQGPSLMNEVEAAVVEQLCLALHRVSPKATIGVITPYKAQQHEIKRRMRKHSWERVPEVNVVDGFQGREVDALVLSCVRGGSAPAIAQQIGFVKNPNRTNVALTRARHVLFLVGDAERLSSGDGLWAALVQDAQTRGVFIPVSNTTIQLPLRSQAERTVPKPPAVSNSPQQSPKPRPQPKAPPKISPGNHIPRPEVPGATTKRARSPAGNGIATCNEPATKRPCAIAQVLGQPAGPPTIAPLPLQVVEPQWQKDWKAYRKLAVQDAKKAEEFRLQLIASLKPLDQEAYREKARDYAAAKGRLPEEERVRLRAAIEEFLCDGLKRR